MPPACLEKYRRLSTGLMIVLPGSPLVKEKEQAVVEEILTIQSTLLSQEAREILQHLLSADTPLLRDDARLQRIADAFETKYGSDWHFDVHDGVFDHGAGIALVFEVAPHTAFGFLKGEPSSQTRWRFDDE